MPRKKVKATSIKWGFDFENLQEVDVHDLVGGSKLSFDDLTGLLHEEYQQRMEALDHHGFNHYESWPGWNVIESVASFKEEDPVELPVIKHPLAIMDDGTVVVALDDSEIEDYGCRFLVYPPDCNWKPGRRLLKHGFIGLNKSNPSGPIAQFSTVPMYEWYCKTDTIRNLPGGKLSRKRTGVRSVQRKVDSGQFTTIPYGDHDYVMALDLVNRWKRKKAFRSSFVEDGDEVFADEYTWLVRPGSYKTVASIDPNSFGFFVLDREVDRYIGFSLGGSCGTRTWVGAVSVFDQSYRFLTDFLWQVLAVHYGELGYDTESDGGIVFERDDSLIEQRKHFLYRNVQYGVIHSGEFERPSIWSDYIQKYSIDGSIYSPKLDQQDSYGVENGNGYKACFS